MFRISRVGSGAGMAQNRPVRPFPDILCPVRTSAIPEGPKHGSPCGLGARFPPGRSPVAPTPGREWSVRMGRGRSPCPFHLGKSTLNPQMRQWINGPWEPTSTPRPPPRPRCRWLCWSSALSFERSGPENWWPVFQVGFSGRRFGPPGGFTGDLPCVPSPAAVFGVSYCPFRA